MSLAWSSQSAIGGAGVGGPPWGPHVKDVQSRGCGAEIGKRSPLAGDCCSQRKSGHGGRWDADAPTQSQDEFMGALSTRQV